MYEEIYLGNIMRAVDISGAKVPFLDAAAKTLESLSSRPTFDVHSQLEKIVNNHITDRTSFEKARKTLVDEVTLARTSEEVDTLLDATARHYLWEWCKTNTDEIASAINTALQPTFQAVIEAAAKLPHIVKTPGKYLPPEQFIEYSKFQVAAEPLKETSHNLISLYGNLSSNLGHKGNVRLAFIDPGHIPGQATAIFSALTDIESDFWLRAAKGRFAFHLVGPDETKRRLQTLEKGSANAMKPTRDPNTGAEARAAAKYLSTLIGQ